MYILRIANISKKYKIGDNKEKSVLNNISLMFEETGLVSIVGKSGSGKSTIMNIISTLDQPTNGCVYYLNQNIQQWNKSRIESYRTQDIGIVFQHYHLLEKETALFNVMLPALIAGKSYKEAEIAAKSLLKSINFKESLYTQKCSDLSGGEKERIAILRAIINNPKILLADEPTGALDTKNSKIVMDLLKEISKNRLVILVSHNSKLVKKYSDRIITLKDGHIESIKEKKITTSLVIKNKKEKKLKTNNRWMTTLAKSNFLYRIKRNVVTMASLIVGLVSSMLIIGFSNGSNDSIRKRSYQQIDYGVATIYKEDIQNIAGSKMSLVQMSRPSLDEMSKLNDSLNDFYIEANSSTLVPAYPLIKCGDDKLEELSYNPVYSFIDESFNKQLLIKGEIPSEDSLFEVLINKRGYEYLKDKFQSEPVGLRLYIHSDYEYHYYGGENLADVVTDYFIFDKEVTIVGVVDDFDFLATPKIYYPYLSLKEYLTETLLVNLSTKMEMDISWLDMLLSCGDQNPLSSYSYRLFLKNYSNKEIMKTYVDSFIKPYKIDSSAIAISGALFDLVNAATLGMELFLVIALLGTALILGIISFSSYTEDKKTSAILTCLGASKKQIFSIYFKENIFICGIALITSLVMSPLLSLLINKIISSITGFSNFVVIPFLSFLGIPLLFPLILFTFTFLICFLSTYIPLMFSKKISPKEELAEE